MSLWIKWEKGLVRKPEILQISARLMVPPMQAAGALMLMMEWLDDAVSDYDEDGNANVTLGALPVSFVDGVVGISGFSEALSEVGWMRHAAGTLTFVNAGRHNGNTAKKRALTRERVEAHRKKRVPKKRNADVTRPALPTLLSSISSHNGRGAGETEPLPLLLNTPEFAAAWSDWLQHRREIKKPVTPQSAKQSLAELEKMGLERAIRCIRFTIFKGWQGLREPDARDLKELPADHPFAKLA